MPVDERDLTLAVDDSSLVDVDIPTGGGPHRVVGLAADDGAVADISVGDLNLIAGVFTLAVDTSTLVPAISFTAPSHLFGGVVHAPDGPPPVALARSVGDRRFGIHGVAGAPVSGQLWPRNSGY